MPVDAENKDVLDFVNGFYLNPESKAVIKKLLNAMYTMYINNKESTEENNNEKEFQNKFNSFVRQQKLNIKKNLEELSVKREKCEIMLRSLFKVKALWRYST